MTAAQRRTSEKAALLRVALRSLVAERGLQNASVSALAERAGVAAGTLYVHYASKEELVAAAYLEAKAELGDAAVSAVSPQLAPRERFVALWLAVHDHLVADPERARFLLQVDASPFDSQAAADVNGGEPGALEHFAAAADMAPLLIDVSAKVLFELALRPAVSIAATGEASDRSRLLTVANACWRAITTDDAATGD